MSSSKRSDKNIVAHPAGWLIFLANCSADCLRKKMPPTRPSASRATQNPSRLRPMKNSGIASLRMLGSGRCESRQYLARLAHSPIVQPALRRDLLEPRASASGVLRLNGGFGGPRDTGRESRIVCGPVPRHLRLCAAKLQWFDQGGLNRNDNQENEGAGADRAGGVRARVTA